MASARPRPPGARMRSRLTWLILKTLAVEVTLPLKAAELIQLIRIVTSWSPSDMRYRMRNFSAVQTYLYRLAGDGYVRLEGLRRQRRATLTPQGRRALEALETLYGREGMRRGSDREAFLRERIAQLRRDRLHRLSATATIREMDRRHAKMIRHLPGPTKATVFISYDVPQRDGFRRRLIRAILRGHGFQRLHQSFYVGPSERLRSALERLEPFGVLPCCRWGTLSVFNP